MKIFQIIQKMIVGVIGLLVILIVISFLPIPGNYKLLIVESGSMEPAIQTGSVVVVKPAESYQSGDVITFQDRGKKKTTTHRIVDLEVVSGEVRYITKGDANNAEDTNRVFDSKILGKVLVDVPYLGYFFAMAKKPIGFVLLVIVPCVIIILEEVGKIWKEVKMKKGKEKKEEDDDEEDKKEEEKEEDDDNNNDDEN